MFFITYDMKPIVKVTSSPPDICEDALSGLEEVWGDPYQKLYFIGGGILNFERRATLPASSSKSLSPDLAMLPCRKKLGLWYNPEELKSALVFPRPVEVHFMLYYKMMAGCLKPEEECVALKEVSETLQCMATSCIHDHIGGGFHTIGSRSREIVGFGHKYSVNHVPDFEKMLYEQGQLANVYLDAFFLRNDGLFSRVSRDILGFVRNNMRGSDGQIFSAVDADWVNLKVMQEYRGPRSINGPPESPRKYMEVAKSAASFIQRKLYDNGRLKHYLRDDVQYEDGFLEDYAFLISGLLDLYEYGGEIEWLEWATVLQDAQNELFLNCQGGGYFINTGKDPLVKVRVKEDLDGEVPSGNSVSAINLLRFASMMLERSEDYRYKAGHLLAAFEKRLRYMPTTAPLMCCAAYMSKLPTELVVLVGPKCFVEFDEKLTAALASYNPNRRVIHIDPTNNQDMRFWRLNNTCIFNLADDYRRSRLDGVRVQHVQM